MKKSWKLLGSVQAAILLATAALPPHAASAKNPGVIVSFPDVNSHWSAETVAWAISSHIVSGYEDGTFRPERTVTEAEFLTLLIHLYKPDLESGKGNDWAEPYYNLAASLNYPVGTANGREPNEPITRIRVAELIASTHGEHYEGEDAIRYLYGKNLAQGEEAEPSIAGFKGARTLTRAEAVQFIKNMADQGLGELQARPSEVSDTSWLPILSPPSELTGTEAENSSVEDAAPVIKLDNQPVVFRTKPVMHEGLAYFSVKEISSAFGIGYRENSDGSVTTTNRKETNTFREEETEHFVHYNPDGPLVQEEEIPLNGQMTIKKINGVYMMPADSLANIWFAVSEEAKKFAETLVVAGGQEDKSQLKFYTYKQSVLFGSENRDGTGREPGNDGEFDGNGKVYRTIWVKEYALPAEGSKVYATWRCNDRDNVQYTSREILFTGEISNGVAIGTLSFEGDITYHQENFRTDTFKSEELYDIELPYANGDIQLTWNEARELFSAQGIVLPE
ncbi:S-layer homology domain-containing protein [Paenibacillus sp. FJAT-26967]|uniref:S-layer homology domain-containing protein n=1 Tax=Paenibacillus sp. FJAT-26967 TaxID=1729690 RepID=UPI000838766B|nr:S-layer homology domain-containing protein [Paenibacillus sp. FJAT-26967]